VLSPVVGSSHVVCTSIVHLSDYSSFALISYRRHKCCPCVLRECMHLSFVQYTDTRTMLCSHFTRVAGMGGDHLPCQLLDLCKWGKVQFFLGSQTHSRAQAVEGMVGGRAKRSRSTHEDRSSNPGRGSFWLPVAPPTWWQHCSLFWQNQTTGGGAKAAFLASKTKNMRGYKGAGLTPRSSKRQNTRLLQAPVYTFTSHVELNGSISNIFLNRKSPLSFHKTVIRRHLVTLARPLAKPRTKLYHKFGATYKLS